MANHPKLIVIPGTFLDAVDKLLKTAPPPKGAKDKTRTREVAEYVPRKTGARKKAR